MNIKKLAACALIITISNCYKFKTNEKSSLILQKCISQIVHHSTNQNETIVVTTVQNNAYIFDELYNDHNRTLIQLSIENEKTTEKSVDFYVIKIKKEIKFQLRKLKSNQYFNTRAKFLIAMTNLHPSKAETLVRIFKELWSESIYNSLLLVPSKAHFNLYSWLPFENGNCGDNFTNYKLINKCDRLGNLKFKNIDHLYRTKIPNYLNACQINVQPIIWPPFVVAPLDGRNFQDGFEIKMINQIAKTVNLKVNYYLSNQSMDYGDIFDSNNGTGMLGNLLRGDVDIGIGGLAYTKARTLYLDPGQPYYYDYLTFCVPISKRIAAWKKILNAFHLPTWILNITVFHLFVFFTWRLSLLFRNERKFYKSFGNTFHNSFGILMGISVCPLPKVPKVRFFMVFWFVFTLNLTIVYKTVVIARLSNRMYDRQVSSIQDILDENLRLQFLKSQEIFFKDAKSVSPVLLSRWINCDNLTECLDRVATDRDSAICIQKMYLAFIQRYYVNSRNQPLMYCFKDNLVSYPITILMKKGFPLKDRIDNLILQIVAAGLLEQWHREVLYASRLRPTVNLTNDIYVANRMTTLAQHQPIFTIWLIGIAVSSFVFFAELCYYKYKNKPRRFEFVL